MKDLNAFKHKCVSLPVWFKLLMIADHDSRLKLDHNKNEGINEFNFRKYAC